MDCCPNELAVAAVAAASDGAREALDCACGIGDIARVGAECIPGPLPDVADGVAQSPGVGQAGADGLCSAVAVGGKPEEVGVFEHAPGEGGGGAGSGCILPLALGGEAVAGAGGSRRQGGAGAAAVGAILPAVSGVCAAEEGVAGGESLFGRSDVGEGEGAEPVELLYGAGIEVVFGGRGSAGGGLEEGGVEAA